MNETKPTFLTSIVRLTLGVMLNWLPSSFQLPRHHFLLAMRLMQ